VWICKQCRAEGEDNFEVCWSCGAPREGYENPPFDADLDGMMSAEQYAADAEARAHGRFVTVASFWTPVEAHLLCARLEATGIRAFVADEQAVGMGLLANAVGGVKVQIAEMDLPRAQQVLAEEAPKREDDDEAEEDE
jgi:hypothetical protein